jgi:hypothetical protein
MILILQVHMMECTVRNYFFEWLIGLQSKINFMVLNNLILKEKDLLQIGRIKQDVTIYCPVKESVN